MTTWEVFRGRKPWSIELGRICGGGGVYGVRELELCSHGLSRSLLETKPQITVVWTWILTLARASRWISSEYRMLRDLGCYTQDSDIPLKRIQTRKDCMKLFDVAGRRNRAVPNKESGCLMIRMTN